MAKTLIRALIVGAFALTVWQVGASGGDRVAFAADLDCDDFTSQAAAQAHYDAAVNAVERAQVGVSLSKRALVDAAVSSPISGVVARKLKNVGELVDALHAETEKH